MCPSQGLRPLVVRSAVTEIARPQALPTSSRRDRDRLRWTKDLLQARRRRGAATWSMYRVPLHPTTQRLEARALLRLQRVVRPVPGQEVDELAGLLRADLVRHLCGNQNVTARS